MRPRLNAAENQFLFFQFVDKLIASMRPRLNAAENRAARYWKVTIYRSFNEAAAKRRGKRFPLMRQLERFAQLQ